MEKEKIEILEMIEKIEKHGYDDIAEWYLTRINQKNENLSIILLELKDFIEEKGIN